MPQQQQQEHEEEELQSSVVATASAYLLMSLQTSRGLNLPAARIRHGSSSSSSSGSRRTITIANQRKENGTAVFGVFRGRGRDSSSLPEKVLLSPSSASGVRQRRVRG